MDDAFCKEKYQGMKNVTLVTFIAFYMRLAYHRVRLNLNKVRLNCTSENLEKLDVDVDSRKSEKLDLDLDLEN